MGKPNKRSDESESKLHRKYDKKEQFYAHVQDVQYTVASLTAQKSIAKKKSRQQRRQEKKLKAYSLSSLLETLPELKEQLKASPKPQEANFKLNCKNRQKLVLEEGKNLSEVFKNHSFQMNPLAAIHQHLRNLQPVPVVEEQQPKKKGNVNGSRKRKMKKARAGVQSMDI
ncbi:uncharacterized protein LOC131643319 [Vicia villosa]|uniref:uncharacterized protein LOC131643319 n=1 Tax=Vicia villosa TaxID=3911 RepID=UPI00273AE09B|nr:uncharacterized protein LOC131643319 [Vicia villosa]